MTEDPVHAPGFDSGLDIEFLKDPMGFRYGAGVVGPKPEYRSLDAIRPSLRDPNCSGPDPVYAIAMDVARQEHMAELKRRMLLFGVVMYASGRLGDEPVRSQGHVHAISPHCGWRTPELFEIWEGRAVIYGQEKSGDDPGYCVAIEAEVGEQVVMPPAWAHYVVNRSPNRHLIFAAWCDRQYGFDYAEMRAHRGLAWYPILSAEDEIRWQRNPNYLPSKLETKRAGTYPELGIRRSIPLYEHFSDDPESIQWVSDPGRLEGVWPTFKP